MKKIYLFTLMFSGILAYSQVYNIGTGVQVTSLSNTGSAAGVTGDISHFLWTAEKGSSVIGTVATGNPLTYTTSISADGKFVAGTITNPENEKDEMGLYSVETSSWKYLGGLSGSGDTTKSVAWNISDDGAAVVGLGYSEDNTAHAIIWTEENGIVDLGTTVAGRTSRANAVNADKTIVVGRQDIDNGSLTGVYWENGVQHSITVNGANIEAITDVSADGKTMISGGFPNPVVWNMDTGATEIVIPADAGILPKGIASGISADGKTVVGYYYSFFAGPYGGSGFIWTKEAGLIKLDDYVANLGLDNNGISFIAPLCISPDGKYIGGIGMNTAENKLVGFVIELPEDLGVQNSAADKKITVSPNPVKDILNIRNAGKIESIEIYNIAGQKVKNLKASDKADVSSLSKGIYILQVKADRKTQSIKFIKD